MYPHNAGFIAFKCTGRDSPKLSLPTAACSGASGNDQSIRACLFGKHSALMRVVRQLSHVSSLLWVATTSHDSFFRMSFEKLNRSSLDHSCRAAASNWQRIVLFSSVWIIFWEVCLERIIEIGTRIMVVMGEFLQLLPPSSARNSPWNFQERRWDWKCTKLIYRKPNGL
jgi:hypothetical protein